MAAWGSWRCHSVRDRGWNSVGDRGSCSGRNTGWCSVRVGRCAWRGGRMNDVCLLALLLVTCLGTALADGRRKGTQNETLTSDEKKLIKVLLSEYADRGVYGRPVLNFHEVIKVHFGLNLIQIMELDAKTQVLTLNVWDRYEWNDTFLMWDPEDFGGVTEVRVPADKIWTPDVKLYNYADQRIQEHREALAVVYSEGSVLWMPQAIYKSSCAIDIRYFPFDIQTCKLKFGSWTYTGDKMDMEFAQDILAFDMSDYIENKEWKIIRNVGVKHVIQYTCCPETYPDLTFFLEVQRSAVFYNYILILPCVLLSTLTLVLFWIPPESPAKMQLGMNIFVAFFVLLLLLEESIPQAALSIPLIGVYYCLNMILITLSSFLNVIVVNLSFYNARGPLPKIIKKVFIECFGRLLCMNCARERQAAADEDRPAARNRRYVASQRYECSNGYNKWSENWRSSAEHLFQFKKDSESLSSTPPTPLKVLEGSSLERQVQDIRARINEWAARIAEKEKRDKMAADWKNFALVLDRIFFFIYLTTVIVSLSTIFTQPISGSSYSDDTS